jgi:hypothetical protein
LKHGVTESDSIDYVFLINDYVCTLPIPSYKNVRAIKKENSFDLAAFHGGLSAVDVESFDAFIFMNSSCIGPFMPAYVTTPWHAVITGMLSDSVKLVAPIIEIPPDDLGVKCLATFRHIKPGDTNVPFVHTYFLATDRVGLGVLLQSGVFSAQKITKDEAVLRHERLTTACILNEGHSVRSLMLKYADVDFSDKANWKFSRWSTSKVTCPEVPGNYDGIDVNPLEVMFVKNLRFPHAHRKVIHAGISPWLETCLSRYVSWLSKPRDAVQ